MTVVHHEFAGKFTANHILWANPQLIDQVVTAALVNQTEAFIDMISDSSVTPDTVTRTSITESLQNVKGSTRDYLKDVLSDLERLIMARLDQVEYHAAVTGIKYDTTGPIVDIEVELDIVDTAVVSDAEDTE